MTRVSRAKIVTLCGSTRFKAQFEEHTARFVETYERIARKAGL